MTPAQLNNNKNLEVDLKKEEPSFFSGFFSSAKSQQQKAKKGPQAMEAARTFLFKFRHVVTCLLPRTATASHLSSSRIERP
jgi:hypothetical protein